ncbi:MAG TPA: methyltransferase domain-containing protein [Deltaproteobacteria bacterium]|nr:methyltransferase domain-containing protein [Deltaproteobacteria bacterium]
MAQNVKKTELHLPEISSEVTESCLRDYDIKVLQPRHGYRFSVDSLLLADFVRIRKFDHILDIGTGCGVIAMVLAKKYGNVKIVAIEKQKDLARIAEKNICLNHLDGQIALYESDLNRIPEMFSAGSFDHIVTNPPYRSPVSGRLCKNSQEALARHEILTDLDQILSAARYALHPGGRVSLIYSADRAAKLLAGMRNLNLEPKRLRMIHPDLNLPAKLILVEGCKDAGEELRVLPPIFLNRP